MATNSGPSPPTNHVITAKGAVGGNRKKQKRRAKLAAKGSVHAQPLPHQNGQPADLDYDEDPLGYGDEDEYGYSDQDAYQGHYKSKKRSASHHMHSPYNPELMANHVPPLPNPPLPAGAMEKVGDKNIWNTSTQQERQNIKDFWLSLSEEERKSLLKIEKEAVLRKMKQQQKHSCSCTVCGRKRTAIEEELEVLYEGYYEELEQYAHHDHPHLPSDGMIPDPLHARGPHPLALQPPLPHHRTSQLQEHLDDEEDDLSEDEEEEDYDEYDEGSSDTSPEPLPRSMVPESFFSFGQNLTVKSKRPFCKGILLSGLTQEIDNILTVADDLLKNDGRKFIEMMEQLAERRMARETQAEYDAANPTSHPGSYPGGDQGYHHHQHEDPLAAGEEFDDDEASYDSQEDYDDDLEDEDEMVRRDRIRAQAFADQLCQGGMTEEQRVAEGRRMFQIFAARMFEQRVLTAYKEKVARERQEKLLAEIDDEGKVEAQREAKRQRDAEKKKAKKKQQQVAKAEEKAKKDADKAAEEEKVKAAEERKLEEARLKKEEQRRKKDEGKRKQDEERAKKEADRTRRLQEEQQRREEADRKAREQRAAEKTKKDEAKKREREEREAREKEARERKLQEEKEKKEREAKAKAEREAKEREKTAQQAAQPPLQPQAPPQIIKRPSQAGMVAVPPGLQKQTSSNISSPHPPIALPVLPKAPTPAKPRQASQQGSLASSPKQPQSQISSVPSKSSSPNSAQTQQQPQSQPIGPPKPIMQKAVNQHPNSQPQQPVQTSPLHQQPIQPPPGMSHPQHPPGGFGGMQHMGFSHFPGPQGHMMQGNMGQRGPGPMFPQHGGPPMGVPNRFGLPNTAMNGLPQSPPSMLPGHGRGMGYPFDQPGQGPPPPGFGMPQPPPHQQQSQQLPIQTPPIGSAPISAAPGGDPRSSRSSVPSHSRHQSGSEKERFESAANQPIARPAPIQRPSSVKPPNDRYGASSTDIEDSNKPLGSSALLDGLDDAIFPPNSNHNDSRRASNLPIGIPRGNTQPLPSLGGGFGPPGGSQGFGSQPWPPHPGQGLSSFQAPGGFPSPQQNWGGLAPAQGSSSWINNASAFASNRGLGPLAGGTGLPISRPAPGRSNRHVQVRQAACQACQQLSLTNSADAGFHPIEEVLRYIAFHRLVPEAPPSAQEVREICDTEGDVHNGGGEFGIRTTGSASDRTEELVAVKWIATDVPTPDLHRRAPAAPGEIGSPMPVKSSPSFGFGAGLGAVGSGGRGFAGPGN